MNCKVCQKNLYNEIDWRNLFKWNYYIHPDCKKMCDIDWKYEVIPIESNEIYFYYIFDKKSIEYDDEFLLFYGGLENLINSLNNLEWSIIFWYENSDYVELDNIAKYLLLKLAVGKIVFISMYRL